MAIDPSIALGFQMPQFMSPAQAQGNAMSLKMQMQKAQVQQQEIQQGQQTLKDQQELSSIASDRSNIDPATGGLTAEALTKLTNPMLRQKLNQDRLSTLSKAAEVKRATDKDTREREDYQSKIIHDVMEKSYGAGEGDLATNPKLAQEKIQHAMKEQLDELAKSGRGGFSKDQVDAIAGKWLQATPDALFKTITTYTQRVEEELKRRTADRGDETPFIKETNYVKTLEGKLADLAPNDPAAAALRRQIGEVKQHIAKLDAPSRTTIQAGQQAQAAVDAKKPLDESAQAAMDIQTWNYIKDGKLPYRKGTGGGADRNDAIVKNAARIAHELGMSPQEIVAQSADWKANAASLLMQTKKLDSIEGQLSSFHNNLDTWDSLAKGLVPKIGGERVKQLAKDLKKVDYTGVRSFDDVKMRLEQQFNDPTTSAIAVTAMAAAMDYGRIMQGPQSAASLTEGVRKEAERLIAASADEKGRKGIMAALESDTEGQFKGLRDQMQKIKGRMSGKKDEPHTPDKVDPPKAAETDADKAAVAWAKANPNDPRAKKIMEHNHGL